MKNYIENCDIKDFLPKINDNFIDLTILDPPYFKVINQKWDYVWKTEKDYFNWFNSWAKEIYRVTRIGGAIWLFGYFRILAYLVPILEDIGFELRQQIILEKGMRSVAGRATKNYKQYPCTTESVLFFIKDNKPFAKKFLKERQIKLDISSKEINKRLGVKYNGGGMWSIYTGNNVCKQFPTKDMWNKLKTILKFELPYEKTGITFNPQMGYTDVWTDIDFYEEKRIHPTQKPIKLLDRIIQTSTNKNDIVLDTFLGSGNTIVSCIKNKRKYLGCEKEKKYFEVIEDFIKAT